MAQNLNSIQTVSTRLYGRDRHAFRRAIVDWQFDLNDLTFDESRALNAAALLVIRAANADILREHIAQKGVSDEEAENMFNAYRWMLDEYMDLIREVTETRHELDGRRTKNRKMAKEAEDAA